MTYYFVDHTADIMLVIKSNSAKEFFNDILNALWEIFENKNEFFIKKRKKTISLELNFDNFEELIFDFISKYIYFSEVKKLILKKVVDIFCSNDYCKFIMEGIIVDRVISYVKAPTYHNFEIDWNNYYCKIVLDV